MRKVLFTLVLTLITPVLLAQKSSTKVSFRIHAELNQAEYPDSISILIGRYNSIELEERKIITKIVRDGKVTWDIPTKEPSRVYLNFLPKSKRIYFLAEPGDNIIVNFKGGILDVSGKGADKIYLIQQLNTIRDSLGLLISNKVRYKTNSLDDYLEWNTYLNECIKYSLPIIEAFKNRLSQTAYLDIRNSTLDRIVDDRSDKFASFLAFARKSGFSTNSIGQIYDSTYAANTTIKTLPSLSGDFFGSWAFVRFKVFRLYEFKNNDYPLNSELARHLLYYNTALSNFKGIALEKFKVDFLTDKIIHELGFIKETDSLLKKYYLEAGYPEYKNLVKRFELSARKLKPGRQSPDFKLNTHHGKTLSKGNLKGKVLLIDFWFTGCVGCVQMTPALRNIEQVFKNDTNVVFLSISIDKNKTQWLNSIKEGKYTTGTSVNLYTGGQGANHSIIKEFQVNGYPSLYLIDAKGNIVVNPVPDPRSNENELIKLIEWQLTLLNDGPYVFNEKNGMTNYQIYGNAISSISHSRLKVSTDIYQKSFELRLQNGREVQPSEFPNPEKLLALSDIEGNFDAFRRLLQANHVIDSSMNWIYGRGHLVFAGDMFDRGEQVTECLWLIYSLEEKAKAAGGYVHFVLGNHELMNLSGNISYVRPKYIENAKLMGKSYVDLYRSNSELGRWLRTKNIIEKVGPLLFTHGGVSPEFIDLGLTLDKVNELARPYYANDSTARKSSDNNLSTIFSTKKGPFWYRDYYLDAPRKIYSNGDTVYKTPTETVDMTLAFYGVKHIVTGHSIVDPGEHVSVHYNNKVINTDTHHAKGKSEALLVEGNNYYRVNDKGQRWLLFKDE